MIPIELDDLQKFLKTLPDIGMEPLCNGSTLLQSCIGAVNIKEVTVGPVVTFENDDANESKKGRPNQRYLDVGNIYEVCAVVAYPTVGLYPYALRKAAGDTMRSAILYHQNLHKLLPRAKKKELLNYMEAAAIRSYEINPELDKLIAEYMGKILNKKIDFSTVRSPTGKMRYRVVAVAV